MWGHLALTLLQQSHLCPLPLLQQPIYWEHDHAMHLYPLPHAVIVGDSSPQALREHQGCSVFNPVGEVCSGGGKRRGGREESTGARGWRWGACG